MSSAIVNEGHCATASKPLRLKRYPPGRLPDPAQCVDCLIIVNDRTDGVPRARVAVSNGASWDHVAWLADLVTATQKAPAAVSQMPTVIEAQAVDLTPYIDQIRQQVLRALPKPESRVIQAPQASADEVPKLAEAMLELSEHVNRIALENADLRARIEFLEKCALAEVRTVR